MESQFLIEKLKTIETPYYYYDVDLLTNTLNKINSLIAFGVKPLLLKPTSVGILGSS